MLRASVLQKTGLLAKLGIAVTRRPVASLVQRSYATTPKHIRKRQKQAQEAQRPPVYLHAVVQLRDAIQSNDISHIAAAYNTVRTQLPLGTKDVGDIAKALHTAFRLLSHFVRQTRIPSDLTNLADLLVADIKARILPPSYDAHLHLLGFYKECAAFDKGSNFWSWLVKQDDTYVNAKLYGVALELLAFQGSPAEETEALYQNALARFPGVFHQYHLAHNALLAHRSQPTVIAGIPMTLLQGILTARILRGDATNAYLTLDTALRLYPTKIPSRFSTLFVQERPLTEAYKVFLLACRSGATPGHDALKILLTRLRKIALARPLENAAVIRSMLMACYAHAASGAALHSNSLNELVIAITGLLKTDVCSHMSSDQLRPITDAVHALVRKLFALWASQNSRPGIAAFNTIIANLAGRGRRNDLIASTLQDIENYGLKPNIVTLRSLLSAAGDMGDAEAVFSAWTDLVAHRIAAGAALDIADWQNLLSAARRINNPDYVRQQLANFEHIVSPHILGRIGGLLDDENFGKQPEPSNAGSTEEITQVISLLERDVDYMAEHVHLGRNFYVDPIPLSLRESGLLADVSEQDIRAVYDEMTTDSSTTGIATEPLADLEPASEQSPATSTTGFPFDELRYQNWKTINELLFDAEQHDSEYMSAVDNAIKLGQTPPGRDMGLKDVPRPGEITGLSTIAAGSTNGERGNTSEHPEGKSLEKIRQEIFRLRGRKA